MSISDYRRPATYQITHHYQCDVCSREIEVPSDQSVHRCYCGGHMELSGESYPASAEDWDEERDNVNDSFRNRNSR